MPQLQQPKQRQRCSTWPAGPTSSFLVISDPAAAKHVLRATDNPKRPLYDKGLVAEVPVTATMAPQNWKAARIWTHAEVGTLCPEQANHDSMCAAITRNSKVSARTSACTEAAPGFSGAQVSKFLFGDGFAVAGGDGWRVRRRAVGPSLHRAYLEAMTARVFGPSALHLNDKLQVASRSVAVMTCVSDVRCCKHMRRGTSMAC